jgi:hypothetical protein
MKAPLIYIAVASAKGKELSPARISAIAQARRLRVVSVLQGRRGMKLTIRPLALAEIKLIAAPRLRDQRGYFGSAA